MVERKNMINWNTNVGNFYRDLMSYQQSAGTAPSGLLERLEYLKNPNWRQNQATGREDRPVPENYSTKPDEVAVMVQLINRLLDGDGGALPKPVDPGTVKESRGKTEEGWTY